MTRINNPRARHPAHWGKAMNAKDQAELIVRRAFDSWFGESLENMEDEKRVPEVFL